MPSQCAVSIYLARIHAFPVSFSFVPTLSYVYAWNAMFVVETVDLPFKGYCMGRYRLSSIFQRVKSRSLYEVADDILFPSAGAGRGVGVR